MGAVIETFHHFNEPNPKDGERPNKDALLEKQAEYINTAIDAVLARKVSGKNGFDFILAVQKELRDKSAVDHTLHTDPNREENEFLREFNSFDIERIACQRFRVPTTDADTNLDELYLAVEEYYGEMGQR